GSRWLPCLHWWLGGLRGGTRGMYLGYRSARSLTDRVVLKNGRFTFGVHIGYCCMCASTTTNIFLHFRCRCPVRCCWDSCDSSHFGFRRDCRRLKAWTCVKDAVS